MKWTQCYPSLNLNQSVINFGDMVKVLSCAGTKQSVARLCGCKDWPGSPLRQIEGFWNYCFNLFICLFPTSISISLE